jgi:MerR family copper efflux transcriptional regulator
MKTLKIPVKGLNFAGCAHEIEKRLDQVEGITRAEASYVTQSATVTFQGQETKLSNKAMTIGQLASLCGVGVETIRYYEREGLLEQPARAGSGYRHYPQEIISKLNFIKRAKDLGFTLKEIKELLVLRIAPDTVCPEVKQQAEVKLEAIEQKIKDLQSLKIALSALVLACAENRLTFQCPIIEFMGSGHI